MSRLAKERGDEDLDIYFSVANSLHRNFYEAQMNKEVLEILAPRIEQLIARLKNLSLKEKALPKKKEVKVEMKRSRGEIFGSALVAAFVVVVAVFPTAVSVSVTAAERGAEGRGREERQSYKWMRNTIL